MEEMNGLHRRRRILSSNVATTLLILTCMAGAPSVFARVELQPCKNSISPQQPIELGQKAVQEVYQRMPVLPDSSQVTEYEQALGQKLLSDAPGYHWPYNFHVVSVADINAFALPGGSIFVNLGTIQAASHEAQLAAVMAHEIFHVVLQYHRAIRSLSHSAGSERPRPSRDVLEEDRAEVHHAIDSDRRLPIHAELGLRTTLRS